MTLQDKNYPYIKICGLTRIEEAVACVQAGADALGFIFFPKSPRHLNREKAADIIKNLPEKTAKVGVFVNESFEVIMDHVTFCRLSAVQLHGQEPAELVERLRDEKIRVIKALFAGKSPEMEDVHKYNAHAYLVECGKGILPGGNALTWNWGEARSFGEKFPLILAGGLSPDNVVSAITQSLPDAVDVSSGVEISPGIKDIGKVRQFIHAVTRMDKDPNRRNKTCQNVFG